MTNISIVSRDIKNGVHHLGKIIYDAPWLFCAALLFGTFLNVIVHTYFNGFRNAMILYVEHPLAFGLAPCVYGKTPYWAFIFLIITSFIGGYYGGKAWYDYKWRRMYNTANWDY